MLMEILVIPRDKSIFRYLNIAYELTNLDMTRQHAQRIMQRAILRAIYIGEQFSKPETSIKKCHYLLRYKAKGGLPNRIKVAHTTTAKIDHGCAHLAMAVDLSQARFLRGAFQNPNILWGTQVKRHPNKERHGMRCIRFTLKSRTKGLIQRDAV